ncbi:hypothetical protein [Bacillus cereus]|uniref:hypothetical protein n=1 Tax=Bacillus cereus TaxID=1396 RepID=UPI000BF2536F|nr:hypothetical protein [Bacillus cereus]PFC35665.1 hypothetical protein CN310_22310 [Bacillus cereus]
MYKKAIETGVKSSQSPIIIARKLFLGYPTSAFKDKEEMGFEILNEIAHYFSIPFYDVHIVGSAKTGSSLYKRTEFTPKESDLDVAIINQNLFLKYSEYAYLRSKGYSDQTVFRGKGGISQANSFKNYLSRGILRPDMLPRGELKEEWFRFFNKLSTKYNKEFKDINAGIYASQFFFESKQAETIEKYIEEGEK